MKRMSWRLDDLSAKVYQSGGDSTPDLVRNISEQTKAGASSALPILTPAQVSRPTGRHCWAVISLEERLTVSDYNATVNFEEDLEAQALFLVK
jgi:hypothetical protein